MIEIDRLILRNYAMDDFEVLYEIMSDPALYQPISEKSVKFRLLVI